MTGELEIKGQSLFRSYLNHPELIEQSITQDGWFKTGDTAQYMPSTRTYKIIGRTNVDIIKSGGFKLSALEIESCILQNKFVEDVVVFGLPDEIWGQKVVALLVVSNEFDLSSFLEWCKHAMSKQNVPKLIECVKKIERNQMGKVDKKSLIQKYSS